MIEKLTERLRQSEGLSFVPYKCPAGYLTIGYGHNLEANGISLEAAELLLRQDIEIALKQVKNAFAWCSQLDEARMSVLVDMCFNMGITRLCGFKKMLSAVEAGDYKTAAKEMLNSKWARQVKGRAVELGKIMETGEWYPEGAKK
ncbi:glycoside hydrolase family protein [Candidatus Proelusimicrobium volucris]|uniref:glycoside hydrolase family protein n=1 Tax=Candidatus Proelusimicrobium volucris TaxID=3416225 RepID=UPI003D0C494E